MNKLIRKAVVWFVSACFFVSTMVIGNTLKALFFPEKIPEPGFVAISVPEKAAGGKAPYDRSPASEPIVEADESSISEEGGQEEATVTTSFRSEHSEYSRTFGQQFAEFLETGQWPGPEASQRAAGTTTVSPESSRQVFVGGGSSGSMASAPSSTGSGGAGGSVDPGGGSSTPAPSPSSPTLSTSSTNGAISGTTGAGYKVTASAGSNLSSIHVTASGHKVWVE